MAEIRIDLQSWSIIRVEVDPLYIRFSGGHEYPLLIIPTKLSINASKEQGNVPHFAVVGIKSELLLAGHPYKLADSLLNLNPISFTNRRNVSNDYQLEFPLDIPRLKFIEEKRRGDLKLQLTFSLLICLFKPFSTQNDLQDSLDFDRLISNHGLDINIPQSHWVNRILPTLSLMDYFLIEIPKGNQTLQEAWKYLDQAENDFRNWNTKGVFAHCRELSTHLDTSIKSKFGKDTFTYKERWRRAYEKFNHWASLDLHLENLKQSSTYPPDVVVTKKIDAEHLLIVSKALLKYAEELLQE
jgi:hypothetical protein